MTSPPLFDPGLQPERTALAWRRTALAVAVGSIVALRVLPAAFEHAVWYLPGALGVLFAAWMWWVSRRRHHAFTDQLVANDVEPRHSGAAPLLAVTVFVFMVGVVALATAVAGGMR